MKSTLKAAGLILAAVVLGLMTVQGTYALWNMTAPSNAGSLQAADFNIAITDPPKGTTYAMATTPSLTLALGEVAKGQPTYRSIQVENAVNVTADSPLRLQAGLNILAVENNFGGNLTVQVAELGTNYECASPGVVYANTLPKPLDLPLRKPQTLCVKVSLNANTPAALMGEPISIKANLSVAQVAPGTK